MDWVVSDPSGCLHLNSVPTVPCFVGLWDYATDKKGEAVGIPQREMVQRKYTVTQEREVTVTASGPADAIAFANRLFGGDTPGREVTNTIVIPMRDRDISAREEF